MADRTSFGSREFAKWLRGSKSFLRTLLTDLAQILSHEREGLSPRAASIGTVNDDRIFYDWIAEWGLPGRTPLFRFQQAVEGLYALLIVTITASSLSCWEVEDLTNAPEVLADELARSLTDRASTDDSSTLSCLLDWLGVEVLFETELPKTKGFLRTLTEWSQAYFCEWRQHRNPPFDLFEPLHALLFPKKVRLQLGEFYTPCWLVEHILAELDYPATETSRLLDPTCGSGVFLAAAARRLIPRLLPSENVRKDLRRTYDTNAFRNVMCSQDLVQQIVCRVLGGQIVGVDANRLAVIAARANLLLATIQTLRGICPTVRVRLRDVLKNPPPICWADFLSSLSTGCPPKDVLESSHENTLNPLFRQDFQFLVGNPPWLLWDNLGEAARQRLIPLCQELGLFDLSGREARHGGAKRDFGVAMVWAATRMLECGGKLGVVLPASLLRGGKAGRSFRQFTVPPKIPLRVLQVEDLCEVSVFPGTIRRTVLFFAEKGCPTAFPVPYYVWQKRDSTERWNGDGDLPFYRKRLLAQPSHTGDATSSWSITTENRTAIWSRIRKPSAYTAYLGANTAGANGIFWLQIIGYEQGLPIVRNCPQLGRRTLPSYEGPIEGDLLYPLLRWKDVGQSQAASQAILLVQDPSTRKAIPEEVLKSRYPLTYSYLCQFREFLKERSACRKLQQNAAWYSQYNVGLYTLATDKVVWRRMDWRFRAVLVGSQPLGTIGLKPLIPQETCCFIPVNTREEGQYLLAILNSRLVRTMIHSSSLPGSRGFASPRILQPLGIPRYDECLSLHRRLAEIGRMAFSEDCLPGDRRTQRRTTTTAVPNEGLETTKMTAWDRCVAELYGFSLKEYRALCRNE
jgi:hypothetical protein